MDNYLKTADQYGRRILENIPHRLILANLTCGLISLLLSLNGFYHFSSLFILLAGLCCFLDERSRRQIPNKTDDINQLDSFADFISFAIAPIILAHSLKEWSILMIIAFISFPLAGAWRMVKLNSLATNNYVLGLPLSVAGIVVALLAFLSLVSPLIMIILSILMICSLEIPKL